MKEDASLKVAWETWSTDPKLSPIATRELGNIYTSPNNAKQKKQKFTTFFTTSEVAHHMQLHFYMTSFVSHANHNLWLSPQELKKSCWICCVSRFIVLHWVVSKYMNETNTPFGQHFESTVITFAANSCSNKSRKVLGDMRKQECRLSHALNTKYLVWLK